MNYMFELQDGHFENFIMVNNPQSKSFGCVYQLTLNFTVKLKHGMQMRINAT